MNPLNGEGERPLAWTAVRHDTPVYASDGEQVGTVADVLGAAEQDIFHGIVISLTAFGKDVVLPADHVKAITNLRIDADLPSGDMVGLEPYRPTGPHLPGIVGILGRLGFRDERK